MADFVFDPLRIGAMLFLGTSNTNLNVWAAASLTLTGLAPSLSFRLAVPSAASLTLTGLAPSLSFRLAVPSAASLTLTGLAPSLNIRLGIQSTTALALSGKQPSLNTGTPDGSNTLIGPVVGARIGLKIDPGVGG